jgi:ferritin-like metal-binding protein YciE
MPAFSCRASEFFYVTIKTKHMANTKPSSSENKTKQSNAKGSASGGMLHEFFVDALKDIYWAENHLTKALPKMQEAATTPELKSAIEEHIVQTEEQIVRLDKVFEILGEKAQGKKCEAMEGLVKEGETVIEETEDGSLTRDVGIIASAQKVEHYEIATYGTLVQLAMTMGHADVAEILNQTLEEEKQTDANLTAIAENDINYEAEQEGEEE